MHISKPYKITSNKGQSMMTPKEQSESSRDGTQGREASVQCENGRHAGRAP